MRLHVRLCVRHSRILDTSRPILISYGKILGNVDDMACGVRMRSECVARVIRKRKKYPRAEVTTISGVCRLPKNVHKKTQKEPISRISISKVDALSLWNRSLA